MGGYWATTINYDVQEIFSNSNYFMSGNQPFFLRTATITLVYRLIFNVLTGLHGASELGGSQIAAVSSPVASARRHKNT